MLSSGFHHPPRGGDPLRTSFICRTTAISSLILSPIMWVDAIDTVTAKLHLAQKLGEGDPPHRRLGTGNRLDLLKLTVGDIADTSGVAVPWPGSCAGS